MLRRGPHSTPRGTARRSPRGTASRNATPARRRNEGQDLLQALVGIMAQGRPHGSASAGVRAMCPDKCSYEMTQSSFREWCRSMSDWLALGNVSGENALISIRLNCDEKLRMAIDATHSEAQWNSLTSSEAFDKLEEITTKSVNKTVAWDKIFSAQQGDQETTKSFVHRSQQLALDCGFKCPHCRADLNDFVLVQRITSGLSNVGLKQEILQDQENFNTVQKLLRKCEIYESTEKDSISTRGRANVASLVKRDEIGSGLIESGVEGDSKVIASYRSNNGDKGNGRGRGSSKPTGSSKSDARCKKCGGRSHWQGKCPADNVKCFQCGIMGHFAKFCHQGTQEPAKTAPIVDASVTSCTVAYPPADKRQVGLCAAVGKLPTVKIKIKHEFSCESVIVEAIPDTGAEVCVVGVDLLPKLGLKVPNLSLCNVIVNHAGEKSLKIYGTVDMLIELGHKSVSTSVIVVQGTTRFYMSLGVCKSLGLVHAKFPNHTVATVHDVTQKPPVSTNPHQTHEENGCSRVGDVGREREMPYPAMEENVQRLRDWLLQRFAKTTFNVSRNPLPMMKGAPHHIHLREGATPHACHTPIPVPKHWEADVKAQLDEDVKLGVIREVPAGTATDWCARMVVVTKKNGKPRRTVDYQELNKNCKRETHHTCAPFEMVSSVPLRTYKTVVDAYAGFHQVPLDEESRQLTTFITPWERYQYCRTPMGHCSAPDAYTKRFDDVIIDVHRKYKCIDDVLLYDDSVREPFGILLIFCNYVERMGLR
ncbi:uncharacterized protein [Macrobrachium rosenbergii]|uniref:uncharacterized protein n=1 Tax=Macrobrachium rosenbergii TaxID=79674 RepID=UPI0034D5E006